MHKHNHRIPHGIDAIKPKDGDQARRGTRHPPTGRVPLQSLADSHIHIQPL